MLEKVVGADDRALATAVIADLQRGPAGDADLLGRMSPQLRPQLAPLLPQIHAATPAGPGSEAKLVDGGTTVTATNGASRHVGYLAYDVSRGDRHALVRVVVVRQDGGAFIDTLYVNPMSASAETLNAFSLAGKSPLHYLMLVLTALSLATIVGTEILLLRTPGVRRKWIWFVGGLFGYGQIAINWATGALSFTPLYLQLLGAFALKPGMLAPWSLGFGLPVVSVIFLLRRRRLQRTDPAPTVVAAGEPSGST